MEFNLPQFLKKKIKSVWFNTHYLSGFAFPIRNLTLEITTECNLNCFMCPRNFGELKRQHLTLDRFHYILNQLPQLKNINISGRGEPLMNPWVFDMLELGRARNINFSFVTNGCLLNEENINRLVNVSYINISIDSANPLINKKIRGVGLDKIIINIKKLKQLKKDIGLSINTVITRENIKDLSKIVNLAKQTSIRRVTFFILRSYQGEIESNFGVDYDDLYPELEKVHNLAAGLGIEIYAGALFRMPRPCLEPWYTPFIFVDGTIYPCCFIPGPSGETWQEYYRGLGIDVPAYKYKMGNIFKDSIAQIWNGKNYRLLRRTIRESETELLSDDEINKRRNQAHLLKEEFPYCLVCLYRQNRAG